MAEKIYKAVQNTLMVTILLTVLVLGSMILVLNIKPYVVLSGSMEPAVKTGSLCFIDQEHTDVCEGDIITYRAGDATITHRVIEKTSEGFITKGDANDSEDPGVVLKDRVTGKYLFSVPKLGYFIMFARSIKGLVIIATAVLCFVIAGGFFDKERKE